MSTDTKLAYTPVTQAYGHSHHSQFIVLSCCTAAQTRPVPNVALRSPRKVAIECFMGRLGQLFPLPWVPVSHKPCIRELTLFRNSHKNKSNGSVAGRPGLEPVTCGVCVVYFRYATSPSPV